MLDSNYVLVKRKDWNEKILEKVDSFIINPNTNGEFINTIKYLDYHKDCFKDDSVAIINNCNNDVCCLMLGIEDGDTFVSHGGTTFSGIVYDYRLSYEKLSEMVDTILNYYQDKYKKIVIKQCPSLFTTKPTNTIDYLLLQKGYQFRFSDLTCVMDISKINNEDELFKQYEAKRRNEVRKVLKEDMFVFKEEISIDKDIWKMMNETLKDRYSSKTTHTYEEIVDLKERFPEDIVPYSIYTKSGEYAAFGLIYKFKNVFHTQYLDLNYKYANNYPNLYLIHSLILQARKENYELFSFGGCTKYDKQLNVGLYKYKMAYGCGDMLLPRYEKEV